MEKNPYYEGIPEDTGKGRANKGQLGKQEPKEETLDVTLESVDPKPLVETKKGQLSKMERPRDDGQDTGKAKNA